jgi:hypothetical protein
MLVLLSASVLAVRDVAYPERQADARRILYVRSGRAADRLALSFDAILADVYWLRTIQHFGRDRKSARTTDRFELLQPLLDLTTTLDPRFNIAYRFGAVFLSLDPPNGPARPDQAIALLEKGLRTSPDRWQYEFDIGFVHYWNTRDFAAAAAAFDRAAQKPGAPEWLRQLAASARIESGDRSGARRMLQELGRSEVKFIRDAAARGVTQLDVMDLIDAMQADVETYRGRHGDYPAGWTDLQRAGLIRSVPLDPDGLPLVYDSHTHLVSLSPGSRLLPLPRSRSQAATGR